MNQMFAKTAVLFSLAFLVSGCASAPTEPNALVGTYSAGDEDSSVKLELNSDMTYSTKASGLLSFSHGGKWTLRDEMVKLTPNSSSQDSPTLAVRIDDKGTYLVHSSAVDRFDDDEISRNSSLKVYVKKR